jgi:hypothetical protein
MRGSEASPPVACVDRRVGGKTVSVPEVEDVEVNAESAVLKLTAIENAYDFIEESLRYAELGEGDARGWKFAIILAAQRIELLLKAR